MKAHYAIVLCNVCGSDIIENDECINKPVCSTTCLEVYSINPLVYDRKPTFRVIEVDIPSLSESIRARQFRFPK